MLWGNFRSDPFSLPLDTAVDRDDISHQQAQGAHHVDEGREMELRPLNMLTLKLGLFSFCDLKK